MAETRQYLVRLLGTRPDWPENMTPGEEEIMRRHYFYLADLVARKKILMAGPCFDPVYGLIILQAESEEEAHALMNNEPSVVGGLHTYDMNPMRVSLLIDYQDPERYVQKPTNRVLRCEVMVSASTENVWTAWTTEEGIKSFFAPDCRVNLEVGGPFEIYFNPKAEPGLRGADSCRILSWLPNKILAFDWNAPLDFGDLRRKHTRVIVELQECEADETRVILTQAGWGSGGDWDRLFDYFNGAWAHVLENLKRRFVDGPRDWSDRQKQSGND